MQELVSAVQAGAPVPHLHAAILAGHAPPSAARRLSAAGAQKAIV